MPRAAGTRIALLAATLLPLLGSGAPAASCLPESFGPRWLEEQERRGGHTLERHVGKSDRELIERLVRERKREDSSFKDRLMAETAIATALQRNRANIEAWAAKAKVRQRHAFRSHAEEVVGRGAWRPEGAPRLGERSGVTIVLTKNADGSCTLITSYPSR